MVAVKYRTFRSFVRLFSRFSSKRQASKCAKETSTASHIAPLIILLSSLLGPVPTIVADIQMRARSIYTTYISYVVHRLYSNLTRTPIERDVGKLVGLSGLEERVQSIPDTFTFTIAEWWFYWDRGLYTTPCRRFWKLRHRIDVPVYTVHREEQSISEKTTQGPKAA